MSDKRPDRLYGEIEALHDGALSRRRAERARGLVQENEAAAEHFRDVARIGDLLREHTESLGEDVDLSGLWTRVRHGIQTPQIDREPTWLEWLFSRPAWAGSAALAALALFLFPITVADVPMRLAGEVPFSTEPIESSLTAIRPLLIGAEGEGLPVLYYLPDDPNELPQSAQPEFRLAGLVE